MQSGALTLVLHCDAALLVDDLSDYLELKPARTVHVENLHRQVFSDSDMAPEAC